MRAALGVAAGLAIAAIVVACGAGAQKPAQGPPPISQGSGSDMLPVSPKQRIEQLDQEITTSLAQMGHEAPAMPVMAPAAEPRSVEAIRSTCEPPSPPPGTCGDTCTIADHICGNATQICDLADQLPGDTWAADKCNGAKASCETARKDCCDCK